jgi:hypothetical protein
MRGGGASDRTWLLLAACTLTAVYVAAYGRFVGRFFAFDDFTWLDVSDRIRVHGPSDVL